MNKELLTEKLQFTKNAIANRLLNGIPISNLTASIHTALSQEGRLAAHDVYEKHGKDALIEKLLEGPGDTWSGRGNDERRSFHDGFLREARDILRA